MTSREKIVFVFLGATLLLGGCNRATEVKGEVFVVTEGAGSYKFGLVEVTAIPEQNFEGFIRASKSSYDSAKELRELTYRRCALVTPFPFDNYAMERMQSCEEDKKEADDSLIDSYFSGFPADASSSTTNADGQYKLRLTSRGRYALFAKAQRMVNDKTERFYWIVWIEADEAEKTVLLSNNNLLKKSKSSPDDILALD